MNKTSVVCLADAAVRLLPLLHIVTVLPCTFIYNFSRDKGSYFAFLC